uniref:Uncharacterized protein n=1 Tax=Thermosporothrix sp. COM3 TaxID=2490863 RepID=A0A455SGD0_9CHLR|nr:hypothetical protein KTC_15670 [Thermosporothrix sp. COM3]
MRNSSQTLIYVHVMLFSDVDESAAAPRGKERLYEVEGAALPFFSDASGKDEREAISLQE